MRQLPQFMGGPEHSRDDQEVFFRSRYRERLENRKPCQSERPTQGKLKGGAKPADVGNRDEHEKDWATVIEDLDKVAGAQS
jgi:hypothetical protein